VTIADDLHRVFEGRSNLAFVALFGSCARGCERPDSDVDLALLPTGAFSLADEADLEAAVEQATGREVDLVRLDRTDDIILRREIAKGEAVFEAKAGLFGRFRAEAAVEWLDFEPVYTKARDLYLRRVAEGRR
jgi:predicted nucleotidyltransferase